MQQINMLCITFLFITLTWSKTGFCADNEEFVYTMKFNGKSTAHSTLKFTRPDSTNLEISWLLKSKAAYKLFFSVDNQYQSFVNLTTGLPEKLHKSIKQKNIRQSWQTDYDRVRLIAETDNGIQWPIQNGCLDILSLLWILRSRDLTPGDSLAFLVDIESHIWKLQGTVSAVNPQHNSPAVSCYRQVDFTFLPSLPVMKRAWKTDLLTNRISRQDTKLTICFGAPPDNAPVYLKFATAENTVEMLLDHKTLQNAP